jgi:hypothetical protein
VTVAAPNKRKRFKLSLSEEDEHRIAGVVFYLVEHPALLASVGQSLSGMDLAAYAHLLVHRLLVRSWKSVHATSNSAGSNCDGAAIVSMFERVYTLELEEVLAAHSNGGRGPSQGQASKTGGSPSDSPVTVPKGKNGSFGARSPPHWEQPIQSKAFLSPPPRHKPDRKKILHHIFETSPSSTTSHQRGAFNSAGAVSKFKSKSGSRSSGRSVREPEQVELHCAIPDVIEQKKNSSFVQVFINEVNNRADVMNYVALLSKGVQKRIAGAVLGNLRNYSSVTELCASIIEPVCQTLAESLNDVPKILQGMAAVVARHQSDLEFSFRGTSRPDEDFVLKLTASSLLAYLVVPRLVRWMFGIFNDGDIGESLLSQFNDAYSTSTEMHAQLHPNLNSHIIEELQAADAQAQAQAQMQQMQLDGTDDEDEPVVDEAKEHDEDSSEKDGQVSDKDDDNESKVSHISSGSTPSTPARTQSPLTTVDKMARIQFLLCVCFGLVTTHGAPSKKASPALNKQNFWKGDNKFSLVEVNAISRGKWFVGKFVEICSQGISKQLEIPPIHSNVIRSVVGQHPSRPPRFPTEMTNTLSIHPSEVLFLLKACDVACGGKMSMDESLADEAGLGHDSLLVEEHSSHSHGHGHTRAPAAHSEAADDHHHHHFASEGDGDHLLFYNQELSDHVQSMRGVVGRLFWCDKIEDEDMLLLRAPFDGPLRDTGAAEAALQELSSLHWTVNSARAILNNIYSSGVVPSTTIALKEISTAHSMLCARRSEIQSVIRDVNVLYSYFQCFESYKDLIKSTTDSYLRWYKGHSNGLKFAVQSAGGKFTQFNTEQIGSVGGTFASPPRAGAGAAVGGHSHAGSSFMTPGTPSAVSAPSTPLHPFGGARTAEGRDNESGAKYSGKSALGSTPRLGPDVQLAGSHQNPLWFVMQNVFPMKSLSKNVNSMGLSGGSPVISGGTITPQTGSRAATSTPGSASALTPGGAREIRGGVERGRKSQVSTGAGFAQRGK